MPPPERAASSTATAHWPGEHLTTIGIIGAGEVGAPDEIAAGATLLASDDATYVNGAEWFIDGGYAQI